MTPPYVFILILNVNYVKFAMLNSSGVSRVPRVSFDARRPAL